MEALRLHRRGEWSAIAAKRVLQRNRRVAEILMNDNGNIRLEIPGRRDLVIASTSATPPVETRLRHTA
jgi:hypothetical protein